MSLDRTRASSLGIWQGLISIGGFVFAALDTPPVTAGKHWVVSKATLLGVGASQTPSGFAGIYLCPGGTPSIVPSAVNNTPSGILQALFIRVDEFQNEVGGQSTSYGGFMFNALREFVVPQQWFIRAYFETQVGGTTFTAGSQGSLSVEYLLEDNC